MCVGGVCQPLGFKTDCNFSIGAQGIISVEPTPFISWKQNFLLNLAAPTHNSEKKQTHPGSLSPVRKGRAGIGAVFLSTTDLSHYSVCSCSGGCRGSQVTGGRSSTVVWQPCNFGKHIFSGMT